MDKTEKRIYEHYQIVKDMNKKFLGLFLQGSQNYNLDYEYSDVDSKAIMLPDFKGFIKNSKPISTTHVLDNDEHIDLKDIRLMVDCFKKQNINFIEILFTKYKIINEEYKDIFQPLIDNKEDIARYNTYAALNCMCGMVYEKRRALQHPYPSIEDKIEKFGYDPKQLHHIFRLIEFMKRYIDGEKYEDCLISNHREFMIAVKRGHYKVDLAITFADMGVSEAKDLKENYFLKHKLEINKNAEEVLENFKYEAIKKCFIDELISQK